MATSIPVPVGQLVGVDYLNEVARAHWRKVTAQAVNTTVSETDILAGSITIDAGAVSSNRFLRLFAFGDVLNNSGANAQPPRFKLKIGSTPTTLIDTGVPGCLTVASATRYPWWIDAIIEAQNASNVQAITFRMMVAVLTASGTATFAAAMTTGEGAVWGSSSTVQPGLIEALGFNTAAIDMTVAQPLALSVINASASASYETKLAGAFVEVI